MLKRRPHWRSEAEQQWIEMEEHHFGSTKRKMIAKKKKKPAGLCMQEIEPVDDLSAYTIWLHGPAGIGKTSLSSMFPKSHLFCCGNQAKALKARYRVIDNWAHFVELVDAFKESEFQTATVDLVEIAYDMCFAHVLDDLKLDYPGKTKSGKDDYGKSWYFIRKEFSKVISKLMALGDGQGLVLISNSIHGERATEEGSTVEDIHPNLSARPINFISGAVDIIGYYRLNMKGERELLIRPQYGIMAKCRIDHRFNYISGEPIESIPMGSSKKEAYDNFVAAFNNELEQPTAPKKKVRKRNVKK